MGRQSDPAAYKLMQFRDKGPDGGGKGGTSAFYNEDGQDRLRRDDGEEPDELGDRPAPARSFHPQCGAGASSAADGSRGAGLPALERALGGDAGEEAGAGAAAPAAPSGADSGRSVPPSTLLGVARKSTPNCSGGFA